MTTSQKMLPRKKCSRKDTMIQLRSRRQNLQRSPTTRIYSIASTKTKRNLTSALWLKMETSINFGCTCELTLARPKAMVTAAFVSLLTGSEDSHTVTRVYSGSAHEQRHLWYATKVREWKCCGLYTAFWNSARRSQGNHGHSQPAGMRHCGVQHMQMSK